MSVLPPLITFILLFIVFRKKGNGLRHSMLSASIVWALLIAGITEILSIFSLITVGWLSFAWVGVSTVLFILCILLDRKSDIPFNTWKRMPRLSPAMLYLLFIIAMIGLIAFVAPPNEWDSMAYHMSRVMHWAQNHSVANYPTNILRQLTHSPWSEFVLLHLQILSGGDRFANLVQWFSMIGSLLGVSLIAKMFGADERGQVFASIVAAAIPMGILQASTTQNDYVVSFWLVCFVYYLLLTMRNSSNMSYLFMAAASLGLAIFTKGTAYIYAFPFMTWFVLRGIKTLRWRLLMPLCVFIIIIISINIGHYVRNYNLSGSPVIPANEARHTYSGGVYKATNDAFTFPIFVSNMVRSISLHLGTPVRRFNLVMEKEIERLHLFLGIDINDPRTTIPHNEFHVPRLSTFEANAGNPIHFLLILTVIFYVMFRRGLTCHKDMLSYIAVITCSFLLFTFLIRWQPWLSRLHLPLFVLWSPVIAVVLADFHRKKIAGSVIVVLALSALLWVLFNYNRPLIFSVDNEEEERSGNLVLSSRNIWNTERSDQFFIFNLSGYLKPYKEATDLVKAAGCSDVGLSLAGNNLEYPFWVLLQEGNHNKVRIKHVDIVNISSVIPEKHPFNDFTPCAIISTGHEGEKKMMIGENEYLHELSMHSGFLLVNVFIKR